MIWIVILMLAAAAFAIAAFVLKLPRGSWALFGAALLFGLTGYAIQGRPQQPAAPSESVDAVPQDGEMAVKARREFFDDTDPPARFVLTADAFTRRGQYENAAKFLRNAVTENPADGEAWLALGIALVDHAEGTLTPAALNAFSRAEQSLGDNPAPAYFLGLSLLRTGEIARARAIWADLLESAPDDAEWRGTMQLRLDRLDAVIEQMTQTPPQ